MMMGIWFVRVGLYSMFKGLRGLESGLEYSYGINTDLWCVTQVELLRYSFIEYKGNHKPHLLEAQRCRRPVWG